MRKGNGVPFRDQTYKARFCSLCGSEFTPNHPRLKRCSICRLARCSNCGIELRVHLHRLLRGSRLCMKCYRGCPHLRRTAGGNLNAPEGTRRLEDTGYVRVKVQGEWVFEHRYVMEQTLGRKLRPGETVHHVDENKQNNSPHNLAVCNGLRDHLESWHRDALKHQPTHHNGRRRKGDPGYVPINSTRRAAAEGGEE